MPNEPRRPRSLKYPRALAAILLAHAALGFTMAQVKRPWVDEVSIGYMAHTLATKGYMRFSPAYVESVAGHDRYVYGIMPLEPVLLAGWYKLFGFSLGSTRALSLLFGVLAVAACFALARRVAGDERAALAAALVMATDYAMLRCASDGRMDMMCLALGVGALTAFALLREARVGAAVLVSEALAAASLFTHPNGIIWVVLLNVAITALERRRLRWRHAAAAAAPYAAIGGAWGLYILQAPEVFVAQMRSNAGYRFQAFAHPLNLIATGIWQGILVPFGFQENYAGWIVRLKTLVLAIYCAGVAACALAPEIRRRRGVRITLYATVVPAAWIVIHRSVNAGEYVIMLIPFLAVLLGAAAVHFASRGGAARAVAYGAVTLLIAVQLGGVAARVRMNDYRNGYVAAADYLRAHAQGGESVNAGLEFGFVLGFENRRLVSDPWMGYHTKNKSEVIVMDHGLRATVADLRRADRAFDEHMRTLLAQYDVVLQQAGYEVYRLKRTRAGL